MNLLLLRAVSERPWRQTYVIKNIMRIDHKMSSATIVRVPRDLERLAREGLIECRSYGSGTNREWRITDAGRHALEEKP